MNFSFDKKIPLIFLLLALNISIIDFTYSQEEEKIIQGKDLLSLVGEVDSIYGETVTGIGDYNLDGYEDFVVGGRMWQNWQGKAWIYFGSENGVNNSFADFSIIGENNIEDSGVCFGHTAVNIGDVNQDGVVDFAVAGPGSWGGWDVGKIYLFYGNSSNYPSLSGQDNNYSITSPIKYDWLGETLSSAGDFNGDTYPDLLIGAPGSDYLGYSGGSPFSRGLAYIFLGSENGFSLDRNITLADNIDFSGFALSLGGTGDINNDGFDDVVVGAYQYNDSQGRIYVYLGSSNTNQNPDPDLILTGPTDQVNFGEFGKIINDLNNDGYDEIAIRTSILTEGEQSTIKPKNNFVNVYLGKENILGIDVNEPDLIFSSEDENDDFGWSFTSIGDINTDSFNDFAIGAPGVANNPTFNGKVYLYYGSVNPDAEADKIIIGEDDGDGFGFSVGIADTNGDTVPDVLIGAVGVGAGALITGKVYIYLSDYIPPEPSTNFPFLTGITSIILLVVLRITLNHKKGKK